MSSKIRHFQYPFQANEAIKVNIKGNIIACVAGAQVFKVSPDRGEDSDLVEGLKIIVSEGFNNFVITNGPVAQTIKVYAGSGDIQDTRVYGSIDANILGSTGVANIPTDVTLVSAGDTSTIAANADRRRVIIQAGISNGAAGIRVGVGTDVSATRGWLILPGASYPFEVTEALTVRAGANGDVFRYHEE